VLLFAFSSLTVYGIVLGSWASNSKFSLLGGMPGATMYQLRDLMAEKGITLAAGFEPSEELRKELKNHVRKEIGALAVPDDIRFSSSLPKTRSGKIMRRLLREIVTTHSVTGDVTTLEDLAVVSRLAAQQEEE